MDYKKNEDYYCNDSCGSPCVSYNNVIDVVFVEDSGDITEPITDAQYCDFAKIDSAMAAADASMVTAIAVATRAMCEAYLNMSLIPRTIQAVLNNGNGGTYLPYGPIHDVSEVMVADIVIETGSYNVQGLQWKQLMWPTAERVTVTYTAGFNTIPGDIRLGMMQAFFFLWDNRSVGVDNIGPIAKGTLKKHSRNV